MADFDFPDENLSDGTPPKPRSGGWSCLGCLFAAFVGGVLLVVSGLGLGYYVLFHTSFPLRQIEALLEEDPDFNVEGLTGSISSGFHVDELRVRDDSGQWQELKEIDFEFNGLIDLISEERLVIDHFTIGGGTLHIDPSEDDGPNPANGRVAGGEQRAGDDGGLKEVRIGLIKVSNLTLVNEKTGVAFEIRELSLRDLHYEDGSLRNLGDIVVDADHVEVTVKPSDRFEDAPPGSFARRIEGVVQEDVDESILEDAPFEIDVLFGKAGETTVRARMWEGALLVGIDPGGTQRIEFDDFGYERYLQWDEGILPTAVTGVMTLEEEDGSEVCEIEPGSTFALGETAFEVTSLRLVRERDDESRPPIVGQHGDGETTTTCRIHFLPAAPHVALELVRGDELNTPALFSETIFGTPYEDLDDRQRQRIDATVVAADKVTVEAEDDE